MYEVFDKAGAFLGLVEKDATGNWIARDQDGNKLSELRAVVGGEREFNYFPTKRAATAALTR